MLLLLFNVNCKVVYPYILMNKLLTKLFTFHNLEKIWGFKISWLYILALQSKMYKQLIFFKNPRCVPCANLVQNRTSLNDNNSG